ncbi:hypothetical protein K437DRAFT_274500 [Tilletiaria anomala UBC 951]|uniref:RING-type domain-containing protein n=1 Tax=Tilletiaria anomala (strain ATCC 24038 / CBS 436.72 / UBC 951) TaxID=1037660 RepID=A0A066W0W5_TILAU|nr:uncharacterized protein K437DRAFT_274500 [Tilletiaria anomala UBC 951]KDN44714.1 hypothetical protein K437DRAFT_274500 [Tilletiaria anomala UBC 951]
MDPDRSQEPDHHNHHRHGSSDAGRQLPQQRPTDLSQERLQANALASADQGVHNAAALSQSVADITAQSAERPRVQASEEQFPDPPEVLPSMPSHGEGAAATAAVPAPSSPPSTRLATGGGIDPEAQHRAQPPESDRGGVAAATGGVNGTADVQQGDRQFHFRTFMDNVVQGLRTAATAALAQQQQEGQGDGQGRQQRASEGSAQARTQQESAQAAPSVPDSPQSQQQAAPLFFALPIARPGGGPSVVRFQPAPLPPIQSPFGAGRLAPGMLQQRGEISTQLHIPVQPIFIPLGASPLPFAFLYDTFTSTAWPLAEIATAEGAEARASQTAHDQQRQGQPQPGAFPGGATGGIGHAEQHNAEDGDGRQGETNAGVEGEHDPYRPIPFQFVSGPPFRISLALDAPGGSPLSGLFGFGAAPQGRPHEAPQPQPDPAKAHAFVDALERADSELRLRMARLGMGDIGACGLGDGRGALGCGICLEGYGEDDRPEWLARSADERQRAQDAHVVAVPCAGHHTLHAGCLRAWLANLPPQKWTCPFCRASLSEQHIHEVLTRAEKERVGSSARTLREEVRYRERVHGWRCNAPACLPRYPASDLLSGEDVAISTASGNSQPGQAAQDEKDKVIPTTGQSARDEDDTDFFSTQLVTLIPCKHQLHVDCLCMALRIEDDLKSPADEFVSSDDDDASESELAADDAAQDPVADTDMTDGTGSARSGDTRRQGKGSRDGILDPAGSDARADVQGGREKNEDEDEDEDEDELEIGLGARGEQARDRTTGQLKTIGKWIQCPTCRREAWAEFPARRKMRRQHRQRQTQDHLKSKKLIGNCGGVHRSSGKRKLSSGDAQDEAARTAFAGDHEAVSDKLAELADSSTTPNGEDRQQRRMTARERAMLQDQEARLVDENTDL